MSKELEALRGLRSKPFDWEEAIKVLDYVDKSLQCLEILKPLCEVYETPAKKYRYLKVRGVVVYEFKDIEEFNLFKGWLDEDNNC